MPTCQEIKHILCFVTKNRCYRIENAKTADKKLTEKNKLNPEGLMIHSVGVSQPSAVSFIKQYDNDKRNDSVHGFIDGTNGQFYQFLPWNNRAWHCGGGGNATHVGVELCEPNTIDYPKKDSDGVRRYADGSKGASSTKWKETCKTYNGDTTEDVVRRTYKTAVELFAFLCKFYDLDPLNEQPIEELSLGKTLICKDKPAIAKTFLNQIPLGKTRLNQTPIDKNQMLNRIEEIQKISELSETPSREDLSLLLDKTNLGDIKIGKKGKETIKLGEISLGKILLGKDIIVISHKWGNVLNVASNHGDPDHLWSEFGLTLQKFRKDIKEAMHYIQLMVSVYPTDTCDIISACNEQLQEELKRKGIDTTIIRAGGLQLGPFETRAQVENQLNKLKMEQDSEKMKCDGFVTWELIPEAPEWGKESQKHMETSVPEKHCIEDKMLGVKGLILYGPGTPRLSVKNGESLKVEKNYVHGFIDAATGKFCQVLPWEEKTPDFDRTEKDPEAEESSDGNYIEIEMEKPTMEERYDVETSKCRMPTTEKSIRRTYKTTVELFAFLCKFHELDPLKEEVIIAPNHNPRRFQQNISTEYDPEHLWTEYDLNMQRFKTDIKDAMDNIIYTVQVRENEEKICSAHLLNELENNKDLQKKKINTTLIRNGCIQLGRYKEKADAEFVLNILKNLKYKSQKSCNTEKYDGFITWELIPEAPEWGKPIAKKIESSETVNPNPDENANSNPDENTNSNSDENANSNLGETISPKTG